jgi:hypothetical protein
MKRVMNMSLALLTSGLIFGCAHDGRGLRMLDEMAEYGDNAPETSELSLGSSGALGEAGKMPKRSEPRIAQVWIYPQRLSEREHFWGAWLSLRIEDEHWDAKPMAEMEQEPPATVPKGAHLPVKRKKKAP